MRELLDVKKNKGPSCHVFVNVVKIFYFLSGQPSHDQRERAGHGAVGAGGDGGVHLEEEPGDQRAYVV